jgi:acetyl coenzyme A synthetase (ADP forming)-like protein
VSAPSDDAVLLRDGSSAAIRPYGPDDRPLLDDLLGRMSAESLRLRFHSGARQTSAEALFGSTGARKFVAEAAGHLVGAACYIPLTEPGVAELAVAVSDAEHGRGIGMRLVERLAEGAREEGIRRLLAIVLAENGPMLRLLDDLGFTARRRVRGSEIEVLVELGQDTAFVEARDARDHAGTVASLRPLFEPRGIAVVGASRRPGAVGHAVLANLIASGYGGGVYAVNPAAGDIAGLSAIASVRDAAGPVDLAVVCVRAPLVPAVVDDCIAAGVEAIAVVTAGFGETSHEGAEVEAELRRRCRAASVRLVGPNCLGVLSARPAVTFDATFARSRPAAGNLAISSQSGAVGIALLEQAAGLGVGVSSFVSVGNRADVSPNDLLEWWEDDRATGVIALYVESFGNPRKFARIARRVTARKPIIALKAGRSSAGARAAASHTAALAAREVAVDALFRQAGIVRADTMEELFDATRLLANQPVPAGNRVAIVTNAGGFGILCADACEAAGLEVVELAPATRDRLAALLPADASIANPVDVLAATSPAAYAEAVVAVGADAGVDAVLALHAPTRLTGPDAIAAAIGAAWPQDDAKPLLTSLIGADGEPGPLNAGRHGQRIPCFAFPESAARALGHAARLARHRRRPRGIPARFDEIDLGEVAAICDEALEGAERDAWLPTAAVRRVLDAACIRRPASTFVATPAAAAEAFRALPSGSAIAKIVADGVLHKSEVGGIEPHLVSEEAASAAFERIRAAAERHGIGREFLGVTIEEEIPAGVECLVGVAEDATFGPLVAFGAGGVETELLADVAFRITPLTDVDADEMLAAVRVRRRLDGFRGRPAGDVDAVRDILLRIAFLADELPHIAELDVNPVIALPPGQGAVAVDARIRVVRPALAASRR